MTAILLLSVLVSTPPQAPPLRAVSAVPPQAPAVRLAYADVHAALEAGASYTVYAGVPLPVKCEANAVRIDAIPDNPPGVYDCYRGADGKPKMVARVVAVAAPIRPVAVTMVAGHSHTCPKCGTTWEHANDDKAASHICPNCNTVVTKKSGSVLIPVEVKPATAKPKRISLNGRWYDEYPDGRRVECAT